MRPPDCSCESMPIHFRFNYTKILGWWKSKSSEEISRTFHINERGVAWGNCQPPYSLVSQGSWNGLFQTLAWVVPGLSGEWEALEITVKKEKSFLIYFWRNICGGIAPFIGNINWQLCTLFLVTIDHRLALRSLIFNSPLPSRLSS